MCEHVQFVFLRHEHPQCESFFFINDQIAHVLIHLILGLLADRLLRLFLTISLMDFIFNRMLVLQDSFCWILFGYASFCLFVRTCAQIVLFSDGFTGFDCAHVVVNDD
jgi:hypothetical protein